MIDNYDSFTYNLVQYLAELKQEVEVYRNDEITIDEIKKRILSILCCPLAHARPMRQGSLKRWSIYSKGRFPF